MIEPDEVRFKRFIGLLLKAGLAVDPKVQNTDSDGGLTGLLAETQDWVTGLTWQSRWRAGGDGLVNPGLERQVMGVSRQTGGLRSQRAGWLALEH